MGQDMDIGPQLEVRPIKPNPRRVAVAGKNLESPPPCKTEMMVGGEAYRRATCQIWVSSCAVDVPTGKSASDGPRETLATNENRWGGVDGGSIASPDREPFDVSTENCSDACEHASLEWCEASVAWFQVGDPNEVWVRSERVRLWFLPPPTIEVLFYKV